MFAPFALICHSGIPVCISLSSYVVKKMWLKYLGMHYVCLAIKNEEEVKGQGELPAYHVYFDKNAFFFSLL